MPHNWTRYIGAMACLLTGLAACQDEGPSRQELLTGRWETLEVKEEERPLQVDLSEIHFAFHTDGTYAFHSTLNYREAGRYTLRDQYLLTTDTLEAGAAEKAVEITRLSTDTLRLRMMEAGKERFLLLTKTEEFPDSE